MTGNSLPASVVLASSVNAFVNAYDKHLAGRMDSPVHESIRKPSNDCQAGRLDSKQKFLLNCRPPRKPGIYNDIVAIKVLRTFYSLNSIAFRWNCD